MVLLLASTLYNTIEYPRYLRRLQQYPEWIRPEVRQQLQSALRKGGSAVTNAKSNLPHTWMTSQHMLPRDWEEVRQMAAKVPQPDGFDLLVGVGQAGGVLADALASAWSAATML